MKALLILPMIALLSFAPIIDKTTVYTGGSEENASVKLTLKADNTFEYVDENFGENSINASGTYEEKGDFIYLKWEGDNPKFRKKWKVQDGGVAITSRNGMSFYRLTTKTGCAKKGCCKSGK